MKLGLDTLLENNYEQFKGKRVGLITNMTGVNEGLIPSIDLFHEHPGINLVALYGPEHGIRGDAKEGEKIQINSVIHIQVFQFIVFTALKKAFERNVRSG